MKRALLLILITCGCFYASIGQDQATNLKKYWDYRDRLREKFVVVSGEVEQEGVNIPAASINHTDKVVSWSDGNFSMNHYLSMLSTELWLLKKNGQDYSETLKELYYAMLAMERLDVYSEYHLRDKYHVYISGTNYPFLDPYSDFNGFHIRDDVSDNFWGIYNSHFFPGEAYRCNSVYIGNPTNGTMEEMSQDNIFHNLEALALVAKLVGTESVAGIPVTFGAVDILTDQPVIPQYLAQQGIKSGNMINFSAWAKDYVKRYLHFVQNTYKIIFTVDDPLDVIHVTTTNYWYIPNPITGQLVQQGSGSDFDTGIFYNAGLVKAGESITGESVRDHDAFILSNDESLDLFNNLLATAGQFGVRVPWPFGFKFDDIVIPIKSFDDYKIRSLATTGNTAGYSTFGNLRANRDYTTQPYEHFPLMYTALHETSLPVGSDDYIHDRGLIEGLINVAPAGGPNTNGPTEWTADSRLIWPEGLGTQPGKDIELSGLDYMILHNLFYISIRGEDFDDLRIDRNSDLTIANVRARSIKITERSFTGQNEYHATGSIVISPGVAIKSGATFRATIDKRAGEYDGTLYKLPAADGGRKGSQSPDYSAYKKPDLHFGNAAPVSFKHTVVTAADAQTSDEAISIYPNPAKDKINVRVNRGITDSFTTTITTIDGVRVQTGTSDRANTTIDVSALPTGIYILHVSTPTDQIIKKISVIH